MNNNSFSVYELNSYIKDILENSAYLDDIYINGEISNFTHHFSGHMYFSLKDSRAKVNCVMFKGNTFSLKFKPQNGLKVIVRGRVSLYERDGKYQIYCVSMEPDGIGSLYMAYNELKRKLEDEGLFEKARKKSLPFFPKRIGVITSKTGAVVRDIINVAKNRFHKVNILIYPAKVQGEGARDTIIEGIKYLNSIDDIEVIIIARGGGSIEELFTFNDESLAREIYKSKKPIISAIGHETDFTIADFVADVRASTPSHASEISVPSLKDINYKLNTLQNKLISLINIKLKANRNIVDSLREKVNNSSPKGKLEENAQYIDILYDKILSNFKSILAKKRREVLIIEKDIINKGERNLINKRNNYINLISKLEALNPINVLKRGYSITKVNEKIVNSVTKVSVDNILNINMIDGEVLCKVLNIVEEDKWQEEKK